MVSDELGTKRTCPSCAARFYDLNKDPITCPKCDQAFVAEQLLPSKADLPTRAKPAEKPEEEEVKKDEGELEENPAVVSLEDLEDDDSDDAEDDEAAAIKDVDLGDTDDDDESDDSDVFLDDEEDESGTGVEDLIGGGPKPGGDEG
ncbi:TIGR02300 family protein [Anderseniella sp. Alg231-50]|uniref:TIGR02300 family protein n=1 Tax=Anderseniella sp. Alg231-50 TaxID=1922226 RepID=UPI000D5587D6